MTYRVRILRPARDDIDAIFFGARDRERLEECLVRVYSDLQADPLARGESRAAEHVRVLFEGPLTVVYRVDQEAGRVEITAVFRPR